MRARILKCHLVFCILFLALLPALSPSLHVAYASPSWLAGYNYRKSHVVASATGAGTDYQIKITVHYGSGSDSGVDVYLNSHVQNDFDDVRFTDDDETTLLSCWLETKVDGDNAVFWVKVADDLSTVSATICIYYGNPSATSGSDGDSTFLFFDHFPGTSLNGTKWSSTDNGYVTVASSKATLQGDTSWRYLQTVNTFGPANIAMRTDFQFTGQTTNTGGDLTFNNLGGNNRIDILYFASNIGIRCIKTGTSTFITSNPDASENIYDILWLSSSSVTFNKNDVLMTGTNPITTNVPLVALPISFQSTNAAGQTTKVIIDWVLLRKYVSPEPSHGAWGTEEVAFYKVSLTSPSDAATETSWTVDFKYKPKFEEGIENASLHIENTTIVPTEILWDTDHWNITAVENDTDNTISFDFSSYGEGTYSWNVEVFNSTDGVFATSNYTLTVDIPPRYRNVGSNLSYVLSGNPIQLYGEGFDGIGLDSAWISTNETGDWVNYTDSPYYISWYRGHSSNHAVGFENSTNGISWVAYTSNPILAATHYFPYVVKDGDCFYMFVQDSTTNMYLYNVTDYTNPAIMNSGNPVYTHSSNTGDWDYHIYNPGVAIDSTGKWHMILEGKTSSSNFQIGYAYSNLTELDWSAHRSTSPVITTSKDAGCPCLTYVPDRNALLSVHSVTSNTVGYWWIIASYASLSDDLTQASSWHQVSTSRFVIQETNVHITDAALMTNFNDTYPIMISYVHAQVNIYQTYCDLSLTEFYDGCVYGNNTITLVAEPSNPTRVPDQSWEGGEVTEQTDFHIIPSNLPLDLGDVAGAWTWSNFTWQNANVPNGTTVQWKIYYVDAYGNVNGTGVQSFIVGEEPQWYLADTWFVTLSTRSWQQTSTWFLNLNGRSWQNAGSITEFLQVRSWHFSSSWFVDLLNLRIAPIFPIPDDGGVGVVVGKGSGLAIIGLLAICVLALAYVIPTTIRKRR